MSAQVTLEEENNIYNVNAGSTVYATIDTISGKEAWIAIVNNDLPLVANKVNPGIGNSAYWIQIPITNKTEGAKFYLEVDYPQLDYLQLFEIVGDSVIQLFETGDRFVFEDRPVLYRNFTFPITIESGESKTYLLNIDKRLSATRFPLTLYEESAFWNMYNRETIFYGFCFGFLALVTLMSLFIGIRLKLNIFFWYGFYILAFGLRCFAKLGYGYHYITSNYPEFNTHFFPFTTQLAMVFLIMYIQRYFDTKKHLQAFNKVMDGILWLFLISSLIWILFPGFIVALAPALISMRYVLLILTIIFAYTSAINHLKIDAFRSRVFLIGYSVFFLGVISQILIEYGAISSSLVPGDMLFVGFFIEVGVLTYAMVYLIFGIINEKRTLAYSNKKLTSLIQQFEDKSRKEEQPFVVLKSKAVVDPSRIRYIQSDDHYLEFYLNDKSRPEVDRNKLSAILKILPPQFVQIHRSTIVNLEYVKTIYGNYLLLRDGEELKLSRTYKPQLEERLSK
ncbi:7TM diverse intracellular signaling domain-containing protein [Ekhidna sp.]|uniref:7TM diverse intracellular signaling domain-containing protein n=1 Tax=Ekhidna sp. TaxID=2608089 RepID=UPI0032EF5D45